MMIGGTEFRREKEPEQPPDLLSSCEDPPDARIDDSLNDDWGIDWRLMIGD
jgi:hypothetical protein